MEGLLVAIGGKGTIGILVSSTAHASATWHSSAHRSATTAWRATATRHPASHSWHSTTHSAAASTTSKATSRRGKVLKGFLLILGQYPFEFAQFGFAIRLGQFI